jgi:hypothetical protein
MVQPIANNDVFSYTCDTCQNTVVVIARADGLIPESIWCYAKIGCSGIMNIDAMIKNRFVHKEFEFIKADFTWHELHTLTDAEKHHRDCGGLFLRRIAPNYVSIQNHLVKKTIDYIKDKEYIGKSELQRKFRLMYASSQAIIEELINRHFITPRANRAGAYRVIKADEWQKVFLESNRRHQ